MATDNRKIQIETEVVANTDALQKVEADFKRMATEAEASGRKASQGLERLGEGADTAASKLDRSTRSIVNSIQRVTLATQAGGKQNADYFALLGQQRGADPKVLEPYIQKLREVEAAQRAAGSGLQQAGRQLDQFGNTAKQTAAALRQVPAQFTDIVVSLQGGTAPLTVLLQQGGQLRDVFGSAGAAAAALGNYIVSLINPYTLLAAAVGTLAVGFFKGSKEAQEYQKALILTGNAAGATAGQMSVLAARIDGVVGTQAKAAEVLTLLASSGKVGVESFERLTTAAVAFERAGGGAVEDVVKNFAELGKDPLQATLKLNESMGYLTRSTYEQIRSLEAQGRATEAAKVAQDAYAAALEDMTPKLLQNLGYAERAWLAIKDAVKETGDAILDVGRQTPQETVLVNLRGALNSATQRRSRMEEGSSDAQAEDARINRLRQRITLLETQINAEQDVANAVREQVQAVKQLADFEKEALRYQTDQQKFRAAEIEIRNRYSAAVKAGYLTEAQLLDLIAKKRKEIFKDDKGSESQLAQLRARSNELDEYTRRLRENGTAAEKLTEDERVRNRLRQELNTNLSATVRAQKEAALVQAEINVGKALENRQLEAQIQSLKKWQEEYDRLVARTGADADAIMAQAMSQEAANEAMGKSRTAIAEATLELYKHQLAEADSSDRFTPEYVAALNSKVEAQKRFVAALKATDYKEVDARSQEFLRNSKELEKAYEGELRLSGLTNLERQKILAQRQVELKYAKEIAEVEKSGLTAEQKAVQIQILTEAKFREISAAVNKVVQEDFARTADQISNTLTDALMRGFENGKDFARNLRDTIVNMFKTMVLRPIVQAVVNPVALTLTSALGLGSNTAQAATGGANPLDLVSSVSSAYNLLQNGVSNAIQTGFGKLASSSFGQQIGLTTQVAGPPTATGQVATQFTQTGQTLSAGLGMAGNALAGYGIQKAISGGYKTGESGLVDAITVAASAYFGPIAGVVAGVFNRAFGRKLADMGITGEFGGAQGFAGSQYTFEKGGWFRSDRTRLSELDSALKDSLSTQFKTIQTQTAILADALGIGSDAIADFTKSVKISFNGLTQDQIAQKIKEEFESIGNDLAKVALGTDEFTRSGESAAETLSRLANSLLTVNSAFDLLGLALYDTSLAGGDAASALADLFGGLDAFKQATAAYYDAFYTDAEQLDASTRQVTKSLQDLGLAMPLDKLGYRVQVEKALAASNEELFAALVKLAPAFSEVIDAAETLRESIVSNLEAAYREAQAATDRAFANVEKAVKAEADAAKQALTDAYDTLVKSLNLQKEAARAAQQVADQNISSLRGLFNLLKNEITSLIDAAGAGMTAAQGRQFIDEAIATARSTGYLPEQDSLTGAIRAVTSSLESSNYATAFEQRRDRLLLANQLGDLQDLTDDQLTVAEQQLQAAREQVELLDQQLAEARANYDQQVEQNEKFYADQLAAVRAQIDELRGINSSVLSVRDAIAALDLAVGVERGAKAAVGAAPAPVSADKLVQAAYASIGRTGLGGDITQIDPEGYNYWVSSLQSGEIALADFANTFNAAVDNWLDQNPAEALAGYIQGVRGYASGGYYPGGLALVGEKGPELINFSNPGMVYNAEQTSTMLGSGAALIEEVRALREDNQAQARAMVQMQARFTKLMERWDSDGIPETRAVA